MSVLSTYLDFARIRATDRQTVAAADLVYQAALAQCAVPENVEVRAQLAAELDTVWDDPRQIEQVLADLIANACQAMPDGGHLTVRAERGEHVLAVAVSDTGRGISPENMAKLVEPLFTTKTRGIRLGLAISKSLVEAHGGWIEVESVPDQGSTLKIWLSTQMEEGMQPGLAAAS